MDQYPAAAKRRRLVIEAQGFLRQPILSDVVVACFGFLDIVSLTRAMCVNKNWRKQTESALRLVACVPCPCGSPRNFCDKYWEFVINRCRRMTQIRDTADLKQPHASYRKPPLFTLGLPLLCQLEDVRCCNLMVQLYVWTTHMVLSTAPRPAVNWHTCTVPTVYLWLGLRNRVVFNAPLVVCHCLAWEGCSVIFYESARPRICICQEDGCCSPILWILEPILHIGSYSTNLHALVLTSWFAWLTTTDIDVQLPKLRYLRWTGVRFYNRDDFHRMWSWVADTMPNLQVFEFEVYLPLVESWINTEKHHNNFTWTTVSAWTQHTDIVSSTCYDGSVIYSVAFH